VGLDLAESTDDGGDAVATVDGVVEDGCTDKTAGTDQGNFHGGFSFTVGMSSSYAPGYDLIIHHKMHSLVSWI
jgi:hypothetical protein